MNELSGYRHRGHIEYGTAAVFPDVGSNFKSQSREMRRYTEVCPSEFYNKINPQTYT